MKLCRDLGLIYMDTLKENVRNLVWLLISLSTPILYLVLFTPLLKDVSGPGLSSNHVLNEFMPGILILMAFGTGIGLGFTVVFQIMEGQTERYRVTPASRLALLLAPILAQLTMLTIFLAIVIIIGVPLGYTVHLPGLLATWFLVALVMLVFASISIGIAFTTRVISTFAAFVNGINLPVLLLSGVLLPITAKSPMWLQVLAHVNPLYYGVTASRLLSSGVFGDAKVGLAFAVLVPLAILLVAWSTNIYRNANA